VPIYNEEGNIRPLYESIREVMRSAAMQAYLPYELILVDDGSQDGTYALCRELASEDPDVVVIRLLKNFGQTAGLAAGINMARGEVLVSMDGDLQNDPRDIPLLLGKLEQGCDIVSGWRKERKDKLLSRRLPSVLGNMLVSRISGVHLHDYGCSLKAYRRDLFNDINLYGEMHRYLPVYASWWGTLKVAELPVRHHPRIHGVSKYGLERTFKLLLDMIVMVFMERFAGRPFYVFGGCGLLFAGLSAATGVWALGLKFFKGISLIQTPLPLLTVLLILISFLSVLMGLLAEMVMRTYYESQRKAIYVIKEIYSRKQACAESAAGSDNQTPTP
jgi:glycosyltransferase involved in cell wall biosynthesis